jgi:hypothetical protein
MTYTQAEREKIHANLDAIKAYIEREIQPHITSRVTVDFGSIESYLDGTRENKFHIYVYPDGVRGRTGGLGFGFEKLKPGEPYMATAYNQWDYAVGLLKAWRSIKATLHTSIEHEKATRNMINNFEV